MDKYLFAKKIWDQRDFRLKINGEEFEYRMDSLNSFKVRFIQLQRKILSSTLRLSFFALKDVHYHNGDVYRFTVGDKIALCLSLGIVNEPEATKLLTWVSSWEGKGGL